MRMVRCGICRNKWVPEMLLASIEPPSGLAVVGSGCFVQARVCRQRRKSTGDANATIISDALPFVEYELYRQVRLIMSDAIIESLFSRRQLTVKMKVLGMNAMFGFDSQIQV